MEGLLAELQAKLALQQAEIEQLRAASQELFDAQSLLRRDHTSLWVQHHSLLDCLDGEGLLSRPYASLRLQKQRRGCRLCEALSGHEDLPRALLALAGAATAGQLAQASRGCLEPLAFRAVPRRGRRRLPPARQESLSDEEWEEDCALEDPSRKEELRREELEVWEAPDVEDVALEEDEVAWAEPAGFALLPELQLSCPLSAAFWQPQSPAAVRALSACCRAACDAALFCLEEASEEREEGLSALLGELWLDEGLAETLFSFHGSAALAAFRACGRACNESVRLGPVMAPEEPARPALQEASNTSAASANSNTVYFSFGDGGAATEPEASEGRRPEPEPPSDAGGPDAAMPAGEGAEQEQLPAGDEEPVPKASAAKAQEKQEKSPTGSVWEVVGGVEKGGLVVRQGHDLRSPVFGTQASGPMRLKPGARVMQLKLQDGRLQYNKLSGLGPDSGWVSTHASGKPLLVRDAPHKGREEKPQAPSPPVPEAATPAASSKVAVAKEPAKADAAPKAAPEPKAAVPAAAAGGSVSSEASKEAAGNEEEEGKAPEEGNGAELAVPSSLAAPMSDTPRVFWTYWDQGADLMPPFNKLCVETWKKTHPEWAVRVLDKDSITKWLEAGDLPPTFKQMKSKQHRADCVKSALMVRHGGIYMDSSIMVWQDLSKVTGWTDIESGQYDYAGYYLKDHEFVENYFLAARKGSPLITAWHKMHLEFWEERSIVGHLDKDPFFKGVKISRIEPNERTYLSQHACYMKLYDCNIDNFRELTKTAKLMDTAGPKGALWVFNRLSRMATLQVQKSAVRGPFAKQRPRWTPSFGGFGGRGPMRGGQGRSIWTPTLPPPPPARTQTWHQALWEVLLWDDETKFKAFLDELDKNQVPLAKFTGHAAFLGDTTRKDLLQWKSLIRRLLLRGLGAAAALPTPTTWKPS